jgi:hypothetical protein
MAENMPLRQTRFWQEVFLAAIRAGQSYDYAALCANKAIADFSALTGGAKEPVPGRIQEYKHAD